MQISRKIVVSLFGASCLLLAVIAQANTKVISTVIWQHLNGSKQSYVQAYIKNPVQPSDFFYSDKGTADSGSQSITFNEEVYQNTFVLGIHTPNKLGEIVLDFPSSADVKCSKDDANKHFVTQ